jgi:hypothetical protein
VAHTTQTSHLHAVNILTIFISTIVRNCRVAGSARAWDLGRRCEWIAGQGQADTACAALPSVAMSTVSADVEVCGLGGLRRRYRQAEFGTGIPEARNIDILLT